MQYSIGCYLFYSIWTIQALENETITVAIENLTDFLNFDKPNDENANVNENENENENNSINININIDPQNPGLYIELLNEIARRGKFTWRFGYFQEIAYYQNVDDTLHSYTDLLLILANSFDVVLNYWFELPSRVGQSLTFPKGWYDASIIIIGRKGVVVTPSASASASASVPVSVPASVRS